MSPFKPALRCGHCADATSGTDECPSCRLAVCPACAADRSGCRVPHALTYDVGGEVMAISDDASKALIYRRGQCLEISIPETVTEPAHPHPNYKVARFDDNGDAQGAGYRYGLDEVALCHCGLHVSQTHSDQTISTNPIGHRAGRRTETLRGRALGPIFYNCERHMLAVTTHGGLHVYACDDDHDVLRRLSSVTTDGETLALRFHDDLLAALVSTGSSEGGLFRRRKVHRLLVYRCHDAGIQTLPVLEWKSGKKPELRTRGADEDETSRVLAEPVYVDPPVLGLSRSHVAVPLADDRVLSFALDSGAVAMATGHEATLCFVGFAGRSLVTADERGHLIVRAPDGDGFAAPTR